MLFWNIQDAEDAEMERGEGKDRFTANPGAPGQVREGREKINAKCGISIQHSAFSN
jgi:hypothetical protein